MAKHDYQPRRSPTRTWRAEAPTSGPVVGALFLLERRWHLGMARKIARRCGLTDEEADTEALTAQGEG